MPVPRVVKLNEVWQQSAAVRTRGPSFGKIFLMFVPAEILSYPCNRKSRTTYYFPWDSSLD